MSDMLSMPQEKLVAEIHSQSEFRRALRRVRELEELRADTPEWSERTSLQRAIAEFMERRSVSRTHRRK